MDRFIAVVYGCCLRDISSILNCFCVNVKEKGSLTLTANFNFLALSTVIENDCKLTVLYGHNKSTLKFFRVFGIYHVHVRKFSPRLACKLIYSNFTTTVAVTTRIVTLQSYSSIGLAK